MSCVKNVLNTRVLLGGLGGSGKASGRLREGSGKAPGGSSGLREPLGGSGRLWEALGGSGRLRGGPGSFRELREGLGMSVEVL